MAVGIGRFVFMISMLGKAMLTLSTKVQSVLLWLAVPMASKWPSPPSKARSISGLSPPPTSLLSSTAKKTYKVAATPTQRSQWIMTPTADS